MIRKRGADTLELAIHLVPRSKRLGVLGTHDGALKVAVNAPPVDGAANEALLDFLAKILKLPKRQVTLAAGASSRRKLVVLSGIEEGALRERLGLNQSGQ